MSFFEKKIISVEDCNLEIWLWKHCLL